MAKNLEEYREYIEEPIKLFESKPVFMKSLGFVNELLNYAWFIASLIPEELIEQKPPEMLSNEIIIEEARKIISSIDEGLLNKYNEMISNNEVAIIENVKAQTGNYPYKDKRIINRRILI